MLKIVHISSQLQGGAGIAALRLHQSLLDTGIESKFVQKYPVSPQHEQIEIYQHTHFHPLSYRIKNKLGLLPIFNKKEKWEKIISEEETDYERLALPFSYYPLHKNSIIQDADIIHLHWTCDFIDYPSFFKNIKQPIVWTIHDQNPFLGIYHYEGDWLRNESSKLAEINNQAQDIKYKSILNKKNIHICCPSKWMKSKSEGSTILGGLPHYQIPYGMNVNKYPLLDSRKSKDELNVNNKKPTILFVADNVGVYRKGFDILTNALNNLNPSSCNLISVGTRKNIPNHLSKFKHTHFDHISDIAELNKLYSAADITVLPSREDNLPNVMIESLINGTPIISFSNGGMAEHIKTGTNGILVQETDANALTTALKDFLNNKYTFDREAIRHYPIEHLNSDLESDRYCELYKYILKK